MHQHESCASTVKHSLSKGLFCCLTTVKHPQMSSPPQASMPPWTSPELKEACGPATGLQMTKGDRSTRGTKVLQNVQTCREASPEMMFNFASYLLQLLAKKITHALRKCSWRLFLLTCFTTAAVFICCSAVKQCKQSTSLWSHFLMKANASLSYSI